MLYDIGFQSAVDHYMKTNTVQHTALLLYKNTSPNSDITSFILSSAILR